MEPRVPIGFSRSLLEWADRAQGLLLTHWNSRYSSVPPLAGGCG